MPLEIITYYSGVFFLVFSFFPYMRVCVRGVVCTWCDVTVPVTPVNDVCIRPPVCHLWEEGACPCGVSSAPSAAVALGPGARAVGFPSAHSPGPWASAQLLTVGPVLRTAVLSEGPCARP